MAQRRIDARLIDRLPAVRGRYTANAALSAVTWLKVGGPAEVLFRPADGDDLAAFLAARPPEVPVTVIGVGSNLLVRDGGVPGIVIRLGRAFAEIATDGMEVTAGAMALDRNVALAARNAGIAGLEFLTGVPGTIGGALRMNAGAFGRDMAGITLAAEAIDGDGKRHRLDAALLGFRYRACAAAADLVFTSARLRGTPGEPLAIARAMSEIDRAREAAQPLRTPTGGSTFVNPTGPEAKGRKAWQLIDEAGCRGLVLGGAQVSEKHCNFLINTGTATAAEIEALGEEVRRRVLAATGVALDWEIRRIGVALPAPGSEAR